MVAVAATLTRPLLQTEALAKHGGMERFAMDFVTVRRQDGGWDCHAIEINMRW